MINSFYTEQEMKYIGLHSYGKNVFISRNAILRSPELINIGNNVRIDDFCIISGKINLGNYIHLAPFVLLFGGKEGIEIHDFSTLSSKCTVYASSDDYSGEYMTNPMISKHYTGVYHKKVIMEKHVIVGASSVILPGVILREGTALGAMSLANKSTRPYSIYVGIPIKKLKNRFKNFLSYEIKIKDSELST